jgi:hypothetical protein
VLEIVAQEQFQPLNSPDDGGTITQKTRLGAKGERGDAGLAKKKNEVRALDRNGYRQVSSKAKSRR